MVRGDRRIWAAGIVYAIGRVNFLADPSQQPHLRTDELANLLGVKQTTTTNKARLIEDTLRIGPMDPEFSQRAIVDNNPMTWLLQVDGVLVDARRLPPELQVEAWRRGPDPVHTRSDPGRPGRPHVDVTRQRRGSRCLRGRAADRTASRGSVLCRASGGIEERIGDVLEQPFGGLIVRVDVSA